ncbi:hypothetical protein C5167_006139 [Papaver somniferum]|uniref:Uncharacterized protein n=1 Tax=Papaver somniferum TaxID=3469 RepID=A0A4Y7JGQ9_PAPSO|nr:hypothetical protein C5167_006139 [Papaver somniferum]
MKLKRESERKWIWVCRDKESRVWFWEEQLRLCLNRQSWPISKTLLDASLWSKFNEMAMGG